MSKEVKIKITVDGKQVEKSVKDLTKEFNIAEKSVGEINQRLKELREAAQQVAVGSQDFKDLNEEIRRLNLETKQASGALNELGQREPLSNVRKGFEDTAFAISSVNTVLGIANELFSGNEKIQKIINRAQLAFNTILTATQLIKEKEAIIDGVRNARLVAYNALLPVATNLTRIFGITTAQAMAVATGGISLLITGVILLISNWENLIDTTDERIGQLEAESSELEFQLELMKLRGEEETAINNKKIQQLESQQKLIDLELEQIQLSIIRNTLFDRFLDLFGKSRQEQLTELIRKKQLNQAEIEGLKAKNEKLKADKKQTKETEKQRDLQKEIVEFIKITTKEINSNLGTAFVNLQSNIIGLSTPLEKFLQNIDKVFNQFRNETLDSLIQSLDKITQKSEEIDDAFKKGQISLSQRNKAQSDLNKLSDDYSNILQVLKVKITDVEKSISPLLQSEVLDFAVELLKPITDVRKEIESLSGSLGILSNEFDDYENALTKNIIAQQDLFNINQDLRDDISALNSELNDSNTTSVRRIEIVEKLAEKNEQLAKNTIELNKLEESRLKLTNEAVKVGNEQVQMLNKQDNAYERLQNQIKSINDEIDSNNVKIDELSLTNTDVNNQLILELKLINQLLERRKIILTDTFQSEQKNTDLQLSKFTKLNNDLKKKTDDFFTKYEGEVQVIVTSLNAINDVVAASFDFRIAKIEEEQRIMEERYDRELELLNRNADENVKRVENSLLSEEVKASEIKRLRDQEANDQRIIENRRERERRALERERNRLQQRSAISQAVMQAALATIQAFAQLGPIAGAIAAAGIAITTGLQIATIKRQRFNKGGKVKGPGSATSDSIPALLSNGESVINANSTKMFEPLLSKINEIGGGVRFNRGGIAGDTPTMTQSEIVDIEKLAQRIGDELRSVPMKTYVVAQDVTNQQQIIQQIKRNSIV